MKYYLIFMLITSNVISWVSLICLTRMTFELKKIVSNINDIDKQRKDDPYDKQREI